MMANGPKFKGIFVQTPQIFPIVQNPVDKYGWSDDPVLARGMWMRLRAEDKECTKVCWYGVGITVHSIEKVTLHVYDMRDNVHGGIGDEIFSTDVTRFTPQEEEMIRSMIDRRKLQIAEAEFERRQIEARTNAIMAVKKELFPEP